MKDYVFIGWSRNRDVAIATKRILDTKGFVCVVGGVYEGNPESVRVRKGTVNETINYQMSHCDQSILLFQKIDDNLSISGNLIYELGYINAQYNFIESATKLHIFKIDITQADDNLFPSDLHGIWGSNISSAGKSAEEIAAEIAAEFLQNQSQIKKTNKFDILSNHYFVEYEMRKHFENPAMSDCDLAMNILVYVQAAFCYQEQYDIKQKMEYFRNKMVEKSVRSTELDLVTQYAMQTLTLYCLTVPDEENWQLNMKGATFRGLLKNYREVGEKIAEQYPEELGTAQLVKMQVDRDFIERNYFESWLISQMQEHVTYLILVYVMSEEVEEEERNRYAEMGADYCKAAIRNLELLAENEDDKMYADLLLSYAYKNLYTFQTLLGAGEASAYRLRSFKLRRELNSYATGIATVRPSLKEYITLEYLLQIVEQIKSCEDKYEREDYLLEISKYIENRNRNERNRNYMYNLLLEEYNKLK